MPSMRHSKNRFSVSAILSILFNVVFIFLLTYIQSKAVAEKPEWVDVRDVEVVELEEQSSLKNEVHELEEPVQETEIVEPELAHVLEPEITPVEVQSLDPLELPTVKMSLPQVEVGDLAVEVNEVVAEPVPVQIDFNRVFSEKELDHGLVLIYSINPSIRNTRFIRVSEVIISAKLSINELGEVTEVDILERSPTGFSKFDREIISKTMSWKFKPPKVSGRPVKAWARQSFRFEFKDK